MKTVQHNSIYIILIVIIQTIIANFIYAGAYITISLLPFILLMLPMQWSTARVLAISVLVSLPADVFAEGVIGLNMASLLPAALVREWMIRIFAAGGQRDREGTVSSDWLGRGRMIIFISVILIVFLALYVIIECSGTRSAVFILSKTAVSYAVNMAIYLLLWQAVLKPSKTK